MCKCVAQVLAYVGVLSASSQDKAAGHIQLKVKDQQGSEASDCPPNDRILCIVIFVWRIHFSDLGANALPHNPRKFMRQALER
eukprot:1818911-Amphidinium_carterae.1